MEQEQVAKQVLDALGGIDNIAANGVCATRLRVNVRDADAIDEQTLNQIPGVLGCIRHGDTHVEIVFGPRYIESVYQAFLGLTGMEPEDESDFFRDPSNVSSINIRISPAKRQSFSAQAAFAHDHEQDEGQEEPQPEPPQEEQDDHKSDMAKLRSMLSRDSKREGRQDPQAPKGPRLLVINGPNINLLGMREPAIYGKEDYDALLALCRRSAKEYGFSECECYQSNHEGDIVDKIQAAYRRFDGIVMNPAAYTHTSVAILDALKAVDIPCVEVHISKVDEREDFRQVSYVRAACFETITGLGIEGYRKAIHDLADHLAAQE